MQNMGRNPNQSQGGSVGLPGVNRRMVPGYELANDWCCWTASATAKTGIIAGGSHGRQVSADAPQSLCRFWIQPGKYRIYGGDSVFKLAAPLADAGETVRRVLPVVQEL
jgi:hypothetical protein